MTAALSVSKAFTPILRQGGHPLFTAGVILSADFPIEKHPPIKAGVIPYNHFFTFILREEHATG